MIFFDYVNVEHVLTLTAKTHDCHSKSLIVDNKNLENSNF